MANVLFLFLNALFTVSAADEGYFWQITDLHYDPTYWAQRRSCNEEVMDPGYYGNQWCDSSWGLVNDSIFSMAKIKKDVDFVLWTGDNIPHMDDVFMDQNYILNVMRNITGVFQSVFPNTPVYPTMGNNDWYPSDQHAPTTHPIYTNTAEMWRAWISDEQLGNFRKGGYYTRKTAYGLRIVGLNTNVYYFRDKLTANVSDPCGQLLWFEGVLRDAKSSGEKVLVTGHLPPGVHAPNQIQWYYDDFNDRFTDILAEHADIIVGLFFGHDHADVLKLLKRGASRVPIYIAPPLTPWRWKIPTETGKPHYPAIRLVKYNRVTSLPLDIHQYYLNLTEANLHNVSAWELEYTTMGAYAVADLSADSLETVLEKLRSDDELLDKYIIFNTVLWNGEKTARKCDKECRASIICSFTYFKKSEFESCISTRVGSSARLGSTSMLLLIAMIVSHISH